LKNNPSIAIAQFDVLAIVPDHSGKVRCPSIPLLSFVRYLT